MEATHPATALAQLWDLFRDPVDLGGGHRATGRRSGWLRVALGLLGGPFEAHRLGAHVALFTPVFGGHLHR